jgi:hypothetical protein
MKPVDVCPVVPFGPGWHGRRDVQRVGEGEGFDPASSEVDGASDVRQGAALTRRPPKRLRSHDADPFRQGRTTFVPGGGVKVNWPGATGSFTRGPSNVNVFVLPCPSRMSTRSTCEVDLST